MEELNEVEMSWQDNVKGLVQVYKKWLNMIGPFCTFLDHNFVINGELSRSQTLGHLKRKFRAP